MDKAKDALGPAKSDFQDIKSYHDLQKSWSHSPLPAWALGSSLLLALPRSLVGQLRTPGHPSPASGIFFSAIFAGSGYLTMNGDIENGAGLTTAWSAAYLLINGRKALRSVRPVPVLLSTLAAANVAFDGQDLDIARTRVAHVMSRIVYAVTGASSGLGRECVRRILCEDGRGAIHLVLSLRDVESRASVKLLDEYSSWISKKDVIEAIPCDLSNWKDVDKFARRLKEFERIQGLLLNAGVVVSDPVSSDDLDLRINHLANHLILQRLASNGTVSRIVLVNSKLHQRGDLESNVHYSSDPMAVQPTPMKSYSDSKLVQAYCFGKYSRMVSRGTSIVICTPGFVPATGLSRNQGRLKALAMRYIISLFPGTRTVAQGGQVLYYCLRESVPNGTYIAEECQTARLATVEDEGAQDRWFQWSDARLLEWQERSNVA